MPDDDPLVLERQRLKKAERDLESYLKKRADTKAKPSPQEEAMKASLQKALLAQQIKYKEEQKKAQAVKREIEKKEMTASGQESHKNILLPQYVMNQDLKVYEEVEIPPASIYKPVGYNDMTVVKTIMEGDDSDKRSEAKKRESMAVERT